MTDHDEKKLSGPDLGTVGLGADELNEGGTLLGHANGKAVLLARTGGEFFATETTCTHYGGPLSEGLFDGDAWRCPWHHARFSVRTGEAIGPPAFTAIATYAVEQRNGRLYVGAKLDHKRRTAAQTSGPATVLIVGAGAAGNAAAETLRDEGYAGPITMVGIEDEIPYDRPNLSKDYLAGHAEEAWIPLRSRGFYAEKQIDLILGRTVVEIDASKHQALLDDGRRLPYGALLLATGADPLRLPMPGVDLPHVHYLRSLADSRAIIEASAGAISAVVVGASFIGLEVAAALIERKLNVHVVAPETHPMERILGPDLGSFVRTLHEEHGVKFHLGHTLATIDKRGVTLDDGSRLEAGLVVFGVGVRPSTSLAEGAGLALDRGVAVDQYLETSQPGIFAAGDIARWPDSRSGVNIRVEHWVVAQQQGRTAARNILGRRQRFDAVPFFWSQHYDVQINYVGHAEAWDAIGVTGSIQNRDCTVAFRKDSKTLAVASIGRDRESLQAELAMERDDEAALQRL